MSEDRKYDGILAELKYLADKWQEEGEFLDNPHDNESDRAEGRAFKARAKELRDKFGL